ncbi:hypothetical protein DFQ26_006012, partial [Actinomortierella ambigua]
MSFQQSANDNAYSQGPGESSSTLRGDALWIRGVNVSSRLMGARSVNMSRQSALSEVHDLLAIIEDCFPDDEREITDQLLKVDAPEVPEQDIDFFSTWAIAAASQEYLDFQRMWNGSSLGLGSLAGDLVRDPLPVPNGYEEVLLPTFYAEVKRLCLAVLEVRKPDAPMTDIEDGARKLPSMMKIALDMLIHQDVQDPTVLGFQVSENICEVFSMNLKHEAIYIPKSLGCFLIPEYQFGIPKMLPALCPLTAAKLIQSIAPHLRQSDLAKCVRVSRSWNDALTPFLWRTLNIDSKRQLERFVTRQTQEALTRNALYREAGVPPDKWATCLVTNLCSVSIRFRHVPGDQKMKILALYRLNPGIRRLLLGSHAYGEWLPSNVTKYLPNLQELHLDGVWCGDVKILLESLPECIRTVQLLAVRHSPTNQDEAAVEVKSLVGPTEVRRHHALESLRIEGDLADKEEEVLAPFLESCSHRLLSLEGLGSTIFLRPKVVEALLRIGFGWRMPERSRSVRYLSDARMAVLISRSS